MLGQFFPILVFIGVGIFFGLAPIVMGLILGPNRGYKEKTSTYECGFEGVGNSRLPFDVRYYLVAILFILFDLEVAFLVPWAVVFRKLGWFGMLSMLVFILLLLVGFIYEWKKGALEWE
ncbi:MAG: NADH-quinone oxidoreductase subunit A [Legionellaceae bacterium]|nr:NADH-quinone oxidoreductase subunit A [Legionellaceae bacterium]|tara:strand:- start:797 stop:1153 length:357 start_codon:yes stop_codon:yes gene_type:complete